MEHSKVIFAQEKKELLEKRRILLREEKIDDYKALGFEMTEKEEKTRSNLLEKVMSHIGLSEQESK